MTDDVRALRIAFAHPLSRFLVHKVDRAVPTRLEVRTRDESGSLKPKQILSRTYTRPRRPSFGLTFSP